MSDRFSRLLRLIRLLQESRGRTVAELQRLLEVDRRTVYRDLERLENEGFPVEQKWDSRRYFLAKTEATEIFSPEETALLFHALSALSQQDPLVQGMRQKLNLQDEIQPLQHQLRHAAMATIVRELQQVIDAKEQVILEEYLSAHSNTCTDRLVEPIILEYNHSLLQAYEPSSGMTKSFKVERIGRVGYTGKPQRHRRQHKQQLTDIFGWTGEQETEVSLQLTTRAATLLREEYPATEPYLSQTSVMGSFPYLFKGPVRNLQGIGRFVLGLPGDVVIDGPVEFQKFIAEAAEVLFKHFGEKAKV